MPRFHAIISHNLIGGVNLKHQYTTGNSSKEDSLYWARVRLAKVTVCCPELGKGYPKNMLDFVKWHHKRGKTCLKYFVPNDGRPVYMVNGHEVNEHCFTDILTYAESWKNPKLLKQTVSLDWGYCYVWTGGNE